MNEEVRWRLQTGRMTYPGMGTRSTADDSVRPPAPEPIPVLPTLRELATSGAPSCVWVVKGPVVRFRIFWRWRPGALPALPDPLGVGQQVDAVWASTGYLDNDWQSERVYTGAWRLSTYGTGVVRRGPKETCIEEKQSLWLTSRGEVFIMPHHTTSRKGSPDSWHTFPATPAKRELSIFDVDAESSLAALMTRTGTWGIGTSSKAVLEREDTHAPNGRCACLS